MKIRTKFIIIFLVLSLAPLAIIGVAAYKNGEEAIKRSLGSGFHQIAHAVMDKTDRHLYDIYHSIQSLAESELMQEVLTGDVDGRILSFLMGTSKEYGYLSTIDVLNSEGEVVASSNPESIGRDFKEEDFYKNTIGGKAYMEDVHLDKISKEWVITFSFPIKAKFEEGKIIGVLSAKWKADELFSIAQVKNEEGEEKYYNRLMLMRGDGLVIAAPEFEKEDIFKRNLIQAGLTSALLASQGQEGYLVEIDEHNRKFLIGYDYSRGYGDFTGLGWLVFVMEDVKIVFTSVERLKIIIFGVAAIVALFVIIISLMVARRMTDPILKISQVATKVAQGNFEERVGYTSHDEIGILAENFNKMTADLSTSIQKEKELASQTAVAEVERKRATELEIAYKKLEEMQDMLIQAEKLNAVGQLASGVAHEVRNPLGIIMQGVDYLGRKISPKEKDSLKTLSMVKDSAKRANKIISSLLDFSRATKLSLQPEEINSILESSLNLVRTKFKFENIEVIKETKKEISKVLVDKNRIEQVFINMFLNSIQAMPRGGKIIIRTYDKKLEKVGNGVGRRKNDHFNLGESAVIVEIEDTGIGISEENLKKIFDPFFTTKGPRGGTGLGLSVSRNIITMHKGLIDIKSQINKGTKVSITFKIARRR